MSKTEDISPENVQLKTCFSLSLAKQTLSGESLATQDYSYPSAVVLKEKVYVNRSCSIMSQLLV